MKFPHKVSDDLEPQLEQLASARKNWQGFERATKLQCMADNGNFEASLAELEKLVALLEQANRPLEEQLTAFEKGVSLSKDCFQRLEAAEERVAQVLAGPEGNLVEAPLAPLDAPSR